MVTAMVAFRRQNRPAPERQAVGVAVGKTRDEMWPVVVLLPVGYLLGNLPSAQLVARARGRDVLHEGSGNPGTSNVVRILGWKAGLLVLALDIGKGAFAAGLGLAVGGRAGAFAVGLAALAGHVFPIGRKGGKGIAVAAGMLAVLYPLVALILAPVWFVVARVFGWASLASIVVTVAFPVLVALLGYARVEVAVVGVLAVLVLVRHATNIRRLLHGDELKLRGWSPPGADDGQSAA